MKRENTYNIIRLVLKIYLSAKNKIIGIDTITIPVICCRDKTLKWILNELNKTYRKLTRELCVLLGDHACVHIKNVHAYICFLCWYLVDIICESVGGCMYLKEYDCLHTCNHQKPMQFICKNEIKFLLKNLLYGQCSW